MLLRYLLFVLFYHKTSCLDFVFIFTSLRLPYPLKPMEQRINISKAVSLFWLFQQPYNMTKVTEKIFKVDANENIEDMDIYYFTQDTSTTPVPLKKRSFTSTIPSTLLEVYSYAPLSSKEKQLPNEESNSIKVHQPDTCSVTTLNNYIIYCHTEK